MLNKFGHDLCGPLAVSLPTMKAYFLHPKCGHNFFFMVLISDYYKYLDSNFDDYEPAISPYGFNLSYLVSF